MELENLHLKNILLVDDDASDIELTLRALAEHNLANRVIVVRNGEEALDFLYRRGKFALRTPGLPIFILLDNKMPKVSGLDVLKTIKADEQLKVIPVIVLTSSREKRDLVEFYKCGVNAYVVKPVDFSQFSEVVKNLGVFWAAINEQAPHVEDDKTSAELDFSEKKLGGGKDFGLN